MVLNGYTEPTITTNGVTTPKPAKSWDETELYKSRCNSKGLNVIQCSVSEDEFRKISNCKTFKHASDILQVVFEGTTTVKNSKIQRLTTGFENIKMNDCESFSKFHSILKDIVNSLYNLGEPVSKT